MATLCTRIIVQLGGFVQKHRLGEVYDSSTGFRLAPNLLLSPDVSFVSAARLKQLLPTPEQFLQGAPDFVVEVLSPSDRMAQVSRKLQHYFDHGTRLAWLVNPKRQQVHIYTPDSIEAFTEPDALLTTASR